MAENDSSSADPPIAREAVAENLGGAYWSVDEYPWSALRPSLPAELVDLLAPPIVVGVVPFERTPQPAAPRG
jgi:hypothetical protein